MQNRCEHTSEGCPDAHRDQNRGDTRENAGCYLRFTRNSELDEERGQGKSQKQESDARPTACERGKEPLQTRTIASLRVVTAERNPGKGELNASFESTEIDYASA